jgi:hypothetical protein
MRLPPGPEGPRRALRFGIDQRDVKVAKLRRGLPLRAARLGLIGQGAPDPDRDVGRRPGASRWRSGRTTRPNGSSDSPTSAPARTRRSRLTHRKGALATLEKYTPAAGSSNRRRARASFHPQQAKMGQTRRSAMSLYVDSRRRSDVSNAQIPVVPHGVRTVVVSHDGATRAGCLRRSSR